METYVAGKGQGKWHGQGQQTAGYSSDELDPYVSLETRAQIEREGVTDLSKRISTLTTPDWTKDIRDEKNMRRLARLSPMAQETVIKFYKHSGEIRKRRDISPLPSRGRAAFRKGASNTMRSYEFKR